MRSEADSWPGGAWTADSSDYANRSSCEHDDLWEYDRASRIRGCGRRMGVIHIIGVSCLAPVPCLLGFIRAVEAGTLEFDRNGGIDLTHLLLAALRAHGNRVVAERLLFGEIVIAVLATVMIGRQRIPPTKSYFSRMAQTPCHATVHILVAALTHWRYGLTSQLAVATLVPSASVRGWLVSLACAEYLGRPASSTGPMS